MPDEVGDIEWRHVFSSVANRVGYRHSTKELLVEWSRTERVSAYGPDFPYKEFQELAKAPSVGSMMKTTVEPKYKMRYVTV